jgi:hypothetical protein
METRLKMVGLNSSKSPERSQSRKVFIGQKKYRQLLGNKYGSLANSKSPYKNDYSTSNYLASYIITILVSAGKSLHCSGKKYHTHCREDPWV